MINTKRKKRIDFGFTPSVYQQKVFDFIQSGTGNAVISAKAGSGKTTIIVNAMRLIPKKQKCIFLAFNKSIAEELAIKMADCSNVKVKTSHSLGLLMLRRSLGFEINVNEYKYSSYVKRHLADLTTLQYTKMKGVQLEEYVQNIIDLINFSRFNLAQTATEIEKIADRYAIPAAYDECDVAARCLEWGQNYFDEIDYTDMIWMPVELGLAPYGMQYDWVFVDECQDFSNVMFELVKKCFKRGTRFVAVGDVKQCINLFAGSNEESFDNICNQPNTTIFDLPVSYRCSHAVINYTNEFVPDIMAREDAPQGRVLPQCHINDLKDGDMVLSRSKSPLVTLYVKLLKKGVNCYIKGSDFGRNLIDVLNTTKQEILNVDLMEDGVFVRLYEKFFDERNKLMDKRGLDCRDAIFSSNMMERYDVIQTLYILSEGLETKTELIDRIKDIFSADEKGICLSTVHKAKGLEAENVYILCRSGMPSKKAKRQWEIIQEENLMYVAFTRAKNTLGFISEKEVPPSGSTQDANSIMRDLNEVEGLVCGLLNKPVRTQEFSLELSKIRLERLTPIELPKDAIIPPKREQTESDLLCELDLFSKNKNHDKNYTRKKDL